MQGTKVLVTGSSGHLGEALVRMLKAQKYEIAGCDILESPFTSHVGTITDAAFVKSCLVGVKVVFHAATLHKPHVATHTHAAQSFIDTNVTGTLNLLQKAVAAGVEAFVFTSSTSVFGDALVPPAGEPAAWITEDVTPVPKNIYGVTKAAAEDLCALFYRNHGLPCLVLRTSRFFPEDDDNHALRENYSGDNLKANEFLYRRVELEDAVNAHLLAAQRARQIGFARYIISATAPFVREDCPELRRDNAAVVRRHVPAYEAEYGRRGWKMLPSIDRVYVNEKARRELGWRPHYDFPFVIDRLKSGEPLQSPLASLVGSKGYHGQEFQDFPYPVQ